MSSEFDRKESPSESGQRTAIIYLGQLSIYISLFSLKRSRFLSCVLIVYFFPPRHPFFRSAALSLGPMRSGIGYMTCKLFLVEMASDDSIILRQTTIDGRGFVTIGSDE